MSNTFLSIDGSRFMLGCREVKLRGVNYSDPDSPWVCSRKWSPEAARLGMAAARELGMNSVRVWIPNSVEEVPEDGPDPLAIVREFVGIAGREGIRSYISFRWRHEWAEPGSLEDQANLQYLGLLLDMLKDDPQVIAYDLMNEADHIDDEFWQWNMNPPVAKKRLNWFRRICDEIREKDTNHPISMGSTFSYSYWEPQTPFTLESIVDFVDFHYYRANYREQSLAEAIRSVKEHTDKPILVGEFGFTSTLGYATRGEPEHSEELQVKMYEEYLTDCESENVAGVMPWVLTDYRKDHGDGESDFGLLRVDYTPKPVAAVYKTRFFPAVFSFPEEETRRGRRTCKSVR